MEFILAQLFSRGSRLIYLSTSQRLSANRDDILFTGIDEEDHLCTLSLVLERIPTVGFRLNKAKCKFLQQCVVDLSHKFDEECFIYDSCPIIRLYLHLYTIY